MKADTTQVDHLLRQAILYVASRCADHYYFGKTKLNKILYYADFLFYFKTGESITGAQYFRLPKGPGPRRLKPVLDQMLRDDAAGIRHERLFNLTQQRVVPLEEPDLNSFTAEQIKVLDWVIDHMKDMSGGEVSELSHTEYGWKCANVKEDIPYNTVFLAPRPLTQGEETYGRKLAAELGL